LPVAAIFAFILLLSGIVGFAANKISSVYAESSTAGFDGGDGLSAATAYEIATGAQLSYLAQQVNTGTQYQNKYFVLIADKITDLFVNQPFNCYNKSNG